MTYKPSEMAQGILDIPSGGGSSGWQRPSEWPDISKLDRTGQVVYITYPADEDNGYVRLRCTTSFKIAVGHIENNEYVVESEVNGASNQYNGVYFGTSSGGYKVIRVTPNGGNITKLELGDTGQTLTSGHPICGFSQHSLEIYGNLPNCANLAIWLQNDVECVDISNIRPVVVQFRNCRSLQKVVTDTWTMTNCTSLNGVFEGCSRLEEVDVSNFCTSSCTNLSGAFSGCGLKTLDLSTWDTSNVTDFSYLFNSCHNLETLTLPSAFVGSKATTLRAMFMNTSKINSLDMSGWDTSNVTIVREMFSGATSFSEIDTGSLDFTKVTNATNMQDMLTATYALKITFPSAMPIFGNVFRHTSAPVIAAFYELHMNATTPPTMGGAYISNQTAYSGKKIYVPYSADHSILNAYKTATNWSTYASYIEEESQ